MPADEELLRLLALAQMGMDRDVEALATFRRIDDIEYIAVADPDTMAELKNIESSTVVAIAVQVGNTRLIDNLVAEPPRRRN